MESKKNPKADIYRQWRAVYFLAIGISFDGCFYRTQAIRMESL